jgi:hypothetical protein
MKAKNRRRLRYCVGKAYHHDRRLTINFDAAVYAEIKTLAKSIGLGLASCGRMLIIEALATRAASPRHPHA